MTNEEFVSKLIDGLETEVKDIMYRVSFHIPEENLGMARATIDHLVDRIKGIIVDLPWEEE